MAVTFVNDTFESGGFLVGTSSTGTSCRGGAAAGPDLAFSVSLPGPAYLFAVQGGNATSAPTVKLHEGSCAGAIVACAHTPTTNRTVGFQSNAVAAGNYVVVADSQLGNGGSYTLVLSRSTVLGDTCADPRPLNLTGSSLTVAGDITLFNRTLSGSCESTSASSNDALFELVAPRSGALTVTASPVTGAAFDLGVSIRSGATCSTSVESVCKDDGASGTVESFTTQVTAGTKYWIRVAGYSSSDKGAYTLKVELP